MIAIVATNRGIPTLIEHGRNNNTGLSELIAQDLVSKDRINKSLSNAPIFDTITARQVLQNGNFTVPSAAELERAIDAYQPTESDWEDLAEALSMVSDEVRNDLAFDPGAWEKHANVLVAAIIALNIARVANAQLRGHFSVMASDAAKSQGAAIIESGKAALNSAITAAVVSGAIAGFAMVKTFQGQKLKHADIDLHKRNAMDARNIERGLKVERSRGEWNPQTTYKINTLDDFGRPTTVDFKLNAPSRSPEDLKWFDKEIVKAQEVGRNAKWLSETDPQNRLNLHKPNALHAKNIERDLTLERNRTDWNSDTTYKIRTFDDFGRPTLVDFKPKGAPLSPKDQAWFDKEIAKVQTVSETSDWLSQMGSKGIEKKLEIGRALNAMSMSMSQVVANIVRMNEHAAREKEMLMQSAQNSQKSLSDEIGQKDAAEAALLQKLMEMVMQLFQSRSDVIRAMTA
ncbi:IpaC/SipC family type III secretion system effector [Pseudomonas sp. SWRI179]|uniref:IpaC/SipC family type III secretion system effector n=1 Tax=Pseudomonas sp. SWRI179 TaxID=2745497 RepID=UPI001EE245F2|nr:IpaC/SipC family type III secretion system effector [Pseudomonas sp. SWRI179]